MECDMADTVLSDALNTHDMNMPETGRECSVSQIWNHLKK